MRHDRHPNEKKRLDSPFNLETFFKVPFRAVIAFLLVSLFCVDRAEAIRRENVTYVEDLLNKTVELKTLHSTPISSSRDGSGVLDTLIAGQHVGLVGIGEDPNRYLVRARVSNGRAEGWVLASDLEQIPDAILRELDTKSRKAHQLQEALKRGEVEMGMTEEVVEKILGKTKEKSIIKEASGTFEQWKYTAYKSIPFQTITNVNGNDVVSMFYRKVPVGFTMVTFQDGLVVRLETKQEEPPPSSGPIIVPPIYVQ